ncbi:energy transducer TonB family protein [Inquilinus limosus]|uniref:energy transducer TonB family protein n=1 Tax=Inquilinus limosus TaxID=171674 RepID=UPI000411E0DF|nr:energy transducer TonB [Inquilinus limosus]
MADRTTWIRRIAWTGMGLALVAAVVVLGAAVLRGKPVQQPRQPPPIQMVELPPPPPPPPPPPEPEIKPPEPVETPEIKEPEPVQEEPKPEPPQEEAKPEPPGPDKAPGDDALDAEGEACAGAACLTARKGGTGLGTGGGGGGGGGYGQYALVESQRAAQRDMALRRAVDGSETVRGRRASVVLTVSVAPDGRIGQVRLAQSCGDPSVDSAVVEAVRKLGAFRQGPPSGTPVTLRIQLNIQQTRA